MWHEISQFDIPDRQLLATNPPSSEGRWLDIGEAKITHTIFGKAKVRIIREQDKKRRVWLLSGLALALMVLAAAAWRGWEGPQQADSSPPIVIMPETKPITQSQTETPVTGKKVASQPPLGLKASEQIAEKLLPLTANKPQPAPLATYNNPPKNQTDPQLPSGLSNPPQPVAPTVATTPVAQSVPGNTAATEPPVKNKDPSMPPTAGESQPPVPAIPQP